jgi:hypothetical protein
VATVANESAFDFEQDDAFSISAWVKVVGDNAEQKIFNKLENPGPNRGYEFFVNSANKLSGYLISTWSGDAIYVYGTTNVNDDLWHHVEMTYDGTSTAPGVKIYLDGVEESLTYNNDSLASTILTDISPTLGKRDGGSLYFEGNIDELKVYDYERTQEQVIEDMNAGHPAPGSPVGSPIAWWKFDEGYGDTAYDSGPQGNNGDLQGTCPGEANCPSWINTGVIGKALDYDGGDYIVVTDDPSLRPENGSWSISTWAKPDDANQLGTIVSKRITGDPYEQWALHICGNSGCAASGQRLHGLFMEDNDAIDRRALSDIDVADGNWHHYAMVADKVANEIFLYMDGKKLETSTYSAGVWPTVNNPQNLQIGNNGTTAYFNGAIDETKVYNFALTAAQVSAEYNQGKATVFGAGTTAGGSAPSFSAERNYCPPGDSTSVCAAPVAEWLLNEKTGASAYDTSDNNYTGTVTNAIWQHSGNCKVGPCLWFDGAGDYVDIGSGPTNVNSIEMWVYPETTTEYLLNLTSTTDYLWINGSTVTATNFTSPTIYVDGVETTYITADEWHHVAVTTGTTESASNFDIGRTADTNYIEGWIDNVVLYDYIRTPAQIAWSYNKGGPIAWWKFDECQGTTAYDSSGKGNSGTIVSGTGPNSSVGTCDSGAGDEMWDNGTTGKFGASLDFDGSDDHVEIPEISEYDITGGITLSAWVNPATFPSTVDAVIVGKYNADLFNKAAYNFNLDKDVNEQIAFGFHSLAGGWNSWYVNDAVPQSVWTHVMVTYDEANAPIFYVNGSPITGIVGTGSGTPALPTNAADITIGSDDSDVRTRYLDGQIDDVKIFNYVLTSEQAREIYNTGAVRFD